jgi:hypothetical protein
LKNVGRLGQTTGTSLDAAALSLGRGASGAWLRAVFRLGLVCRATVYLLVGYLALRLALAARGREGAPASSAGAVQEAVATNTVGRRRQRAVSAWGFLLYSAFCLSTARLLAGTPPKQTAQSEQRQDTDVTAVLLRTGWGRLFLILVGVIVVAAGVEVGRRSVRLDFPERFTASTCPGRWPCSRGRWARWAASRAPSFSCWSVSLC